MRGGKPFPRGLGDGVAGTSAFPDGVWERGERTAVQDAQAAREAGEPKDDPLHTGQFTLNTPPDPNHRTVPDAFAKHDPDMPVVASPSQPASTARTAVPATNSPDSRILSPPPVH